jgi:hypothetical protein
MDREYGRMYYSSGSNEGGSNRGGSSSNSRQYTETYMRDPREGRSYNSRKMYMESKEMHKDKSSQLKELEKYMQELTQDMVEMIEGASPEEKQYLEKRVSALASKIGQIS